MRPLAIVMLTTAALFGTDLLPARSAEPAPESETQTIAQVIVVRVTNACFSAAIRVTGYLAARDEAVVQLGGGEKVVEVLAAEGDKVTVDQILARVSRQSVDPSKPGGSTAETVAVKAPAAGVIVKSTALVGATPSVLQRAPLFAIAINNQIELEAEVPSIYVPQLSPGQNATVQLPDRSELSGKVRLVPAAIDQKTQLGRARIILEDAPNLRYGMFTSATISADRSCGISVPNSAVTYRTDGTSVQVVRNDAIETRRIEVGIHSDSDTEVSKGLEDGELVVANAGTSLHNGDRVKPIDAAQPGGARF
jgi:hypothetical protein